MQAISQVSKIERRAPISLNKASVKAYLLFLG